MAEVTIYHNPRCSKSRQTLALLEERGISPTTVFYLDTPPDAQELKRIVAALNIGVRDLMRTKESVYADLGLAQESDEDKLISAMIANPILIERPIVVHNGKAAVGRPPENVLEIL